MNHQHTMLSSMNLSRTGALLFKNLMPSQNPSSRILLRNSIQRSNLVIPTLNHQFRRSFSDSIDIPKPDTTSARIDYLRTQINESKIELEKLTLPTLNYLPRRSFSDSTSIPKSDITSAGINYMKPQINENKAELEKLSISSKESNDNLFTKILEKSRTVRQEQEPESEFKLSDFTVGGALLGLLGVICTPFVAALVFMLGMVWTAASIVLAWYVVKFLLGGGWGRD